MQYFCYLVGQLTSQKTTQKNPQDDIAHREQAEQQSTEEAGGDNEISGRRRAARPNDR